MTTEQITLDSISEQFVEMIRGRLKPGAEGRMATWEACFKMALKGECDYDTAEKKLRELLQFTTFTK